MEKLKAFLQEWHSTTPFITAHTSGSTGTPKSIRLLKSDMVASARATIAHFGITSDSVLGLPLSIDYIAGKMMAVRAEVVGCRLLTLPVSNNLCITERVDLLSVVPAQLAALLMRPERERNVKRYLLGGATPGRALIDMIVATGVEVWAGYGMTETCSHVALRRLDGVSELYTAMPGIRFESDPRGCLVVCSERFSWQRLVTNDVVELMSDREFRYVGRADNIINSGGIKVSPERIEALICDSATDPLPPFYITARPSAKWGQQPVAMVEGSDREAVLIGALVKTIEWPRGWRPAAVVAVESFARTDSGKVIRTCLFS